MHVPEAFVHPIVVQQWRVNDVLQKTASYACYMNFLSQYTTDSYSNPTVSLAG